MFSVRCATIHFVTAVMMLLSAAFARANEPAEGEARLDSAATQYLLPEVIVTATRLPTPRTASATALTVINESDLAVRPGVRLASALASLPGAFLRPYGGGGALQTVSFRGMAAEHTLLVVDNQPVNNLQNGQADFGILSRLGIERVEIVRGGHSALYGADAVGGVVRAFTKRPTQELSLHAAVGTGSAGYFSRELGVSGSIGTLGILVGLRGERADGKYPYLYGGSGRAVEYERLGADHDLVEGLARLTWGVLPGVETELSFSGSDADRGVPGPVIRPDDPGGARLSDKNARLSWAGSWKPTGALLARLTASVESNRQRYLDPTIDLGTQGGLQSSSDLKVYRISPEFEHTLGRSLEGVLGMELQDAEIIATNTGTRSRRQWSVWYSAYLSVVSGEDLLHDLSLYPSLRYDRFSDFGEAWSPKLGVSLSPLRTLPLKVRASYGASFRAPTFNELFWIPGGNPTLRPERSTAFDAGVMVTVPLSGVLRVEAGIFSSVTRDRILWLPGPGTIWSPENVGRVAAQGVELEAEWTGLEGLLHLTVNSTWTDARKASSRDADDPTVDNQLVYIPPQTVNAAVEVHAEPVDFRAQHSWVSFRYVTESNDQVLPAYGVTSVSARVLFPLGGPAISVSGEIDNLWNESYEVMPNYPMPLRAFRVTLGVEL